ncbi:hypothetical protein NPIL_375631 [Nephila pilipes]|uniref:Uncharacterized protein n=1 Tax=Nephila pilipes TaxID=299642 RepID=A0A8X6MVV7_NEPPI|nr:hypothetical protein NPIL_375631 [Nephila pilipes]
MRALPKSSTDLPKLITNVFHIQAPLNKAMNVSPRVSVEHTWSSSNPKNNFKPLIWHATRYLHSRHVSSYSINMQNCDVTGHSGNKTPRESDVTGGVPHKFATPRQLS